MHWRAATPARASASVFRTCDATFLLQASFAPAYLLTDGGPDLATLFLPVYLFDVGFEQFRYGYAAAMTLAMFAVTVALALVAALLVRRRFS